MSTYEQTSAKTPSSGENRELVVVMPVYNEEASISKVFCEWHTEISRWTDSFHFLIINDGSTDGTAKVLGLLAQSRDTKLTVITQENAGHGQTCLRGYAWAVERGARYVLQVDSDGQCDPQFFGEFWSMRDDYDVIYGKRVTRDDGKFRVFASWIMKLSLLIFYRVFCVDANVPYRLIQASALAPVLGKIPANFNLANVALAVLLKRNPAVRHGYVKIRFRRRYGGTPSVPVEKFFSRGVQLIEQLRSLR